MNIKKICELTQTGKETLRLYREKGLLHPHKNPDNRYYDYSVHDLVTLLFVKKLRYFSLPLASIKALLNSESPQPIIEHYDDQIDELQQEIMQLQKKISHIKIARQHLINSLDLDQKVREMDFKIYRYDVYDKEMVERLKNSAIYINSLLIKEEDLLDEAGACPVHLALGFDDSILSEYQLSITSGAIVTPPGHYLCTCIPIESFDVMDKGKLRHLFEYAKKKRYRIVGHLVSFLVHIDRREAGTVFYYRVRVRVEKMDGSDFES